MRTEIDRLQFYGEETRMPHRLIEKKRRDRINLSIGCLKDLLPDEMKTEVNYFPGNYYGNRT